MVPYNNFKSKLSSCQKNYYIIRKIILTFQVRIYIYKKFKEKFEIKHSIKNIPKAKMKSTKKS